MAAQTVADGTPAATAAQSRQRKRTAHDWSRECMTSEFRRATMDQVSGPATRPNEALYSHAEPGSSQTYTPSTTLTCQHRKQVCGQALSVATILQAGFPGNAHAREC